MNSRTLRNLAGDPRFVPGIYNYCDRWCERCSLSNRCLNYAAEKIDHDADPAAHDMSNRKFWHKLRRNFQSAIKMLRADAKARGIDLDDPKLTAEAKAQQRAGRRLAAKNRSLTRTAMAYATAADKWFEGAAPVFKVKGLELETLARLEVGDPHAEAAELADLIEVIRWYQHFIYVKLCRAIDSRANEKLHSKEAMKASPKDSEGSAKIALIAMDRSIAAWSALRTALGGDDADGILDLLVQLAGIRRETEKLFPRARAFVRPGFDEHPQPRAHT